MRVYLNAVGLRAPGLPDWASSRDVLRGERCLHPDALPAVSLPLPPAERRRTSASARAAWAVADQALRAGKAAADAINSVFVSGNGDAVILDQLCSALAQPGHAVSPTQFHNSVHNAPAGYYSIASRSHAPSTSLAAHPAPFSAGLLEAAVQVASEACDVLLVAYDLIAPFPLAPFWPAQQDFALALLLAAQPGETTLAQLDIDAIAPGEREFSRTHQPWQAALAADNALADSLHLLTAVALGRPASLLLPYLDQLALKVELQCC
jgi:hypothetical protein